MKRVKVIFSAVLSASVLTGCASITQESSQSIKVETLDQVGRPVAGAQCELDNGAGVVRVTTPGIALVDKSYSNLQVVCTTPDQQKANAQVVSRVGSAVFGNLILGGGVGAIIDSSTGVAYNYPNWIQLVVGKSLLFDRDDHTEDSKPTPPRDPQVVTVEKAEGQS